MAKGFDDEKKETTSARCQELKLFVSFFEMFSPSASVLEDEDVVFLVRNTAFSESDIREWWR